LSECGGVPEERIITFHTAAEIEREGSAEVQWIVRNWVASGSITEVVGKIKLAGKTTFLLNMSRAVLEGHRVDRRSPRGKNSG
jgi:hypothetical protein